MYIGLLYAYLTTFYQLRFYVVSKYWNIVNNGLKST
jgi:hypothetical protein